MIAKRIDSIMLKTKTVSARALPEGIEVTFAPAEEGGTAPAPQVHDLVLQAVGRTPNGKKIAADKAGVVVKDRVFINVDIQMRTNVPHVAAELIAGPLGNKELAAAAFNARVIPSVAYTDSEVAWVGLTEDFGLAPKASKSRRAYSPMIGEVALAIEMGADAVDIGTTIHPHPTLGESIGMAAEVAHGSCTDLPPARK